MSERPPPGLGTRDRILDAARLCLLRDGFAALTTRSIAETAGVPVSQTHYHFGSKRALVLALLERENARLLERQSLMYGDDMPLWKQWEQACDFFEEDLASGYVRVLQEMIAAGWSDPDVAAAVRRDLTGWQSLLADVAQHFADRHHGVGPFTPTEISVLVGAAFMGAESLALLGFEESEQPARGALRKIGELIRQYEEAETLGSG